MSHSNIDFAFIILLPSFLYNLLCLRIFLIILGSTHPSIQWVLRGSSLGYSRRGVKPTTRLDIVPKLKMCRAVPPLTHTSLRHIQEQTLHFALLLVFLCRVLPLFPFTSLSLSCIQSFPPTHTLCVYKPHAPLALPPLRTITTVPISAAFKSDSSPRPDSLFLRGYYI